MLSIAMCSLFTVASFGQTVIFEEGFETDGHPSRYTASSSGGFNSGDTSHFRRTGGLDLTVRNINPYSGFSGMYFWAADDTDHFTGDGMDEQTIVFDPIDIAGVTGLSISGLFGAGNDFLPGEAQSHEGYSPEAYLRLTYQIDLGEETDVLCFRHEDHPGGSNDPFGLDADCNGTADNLDGTGRLVPDFAAYSANILETGNSLRVRIRVHATGTNEEMAFDDIKVTGIMQTNLPEEDRAIEFALEQNYPNPFNPSTVINYSVANSGEVSLSVYNLLGQKVAQLVTGLKASGSYNVTWNAAGVAGGLYYYRLEAGGKTLIKKMMLIK